MYWAYIHGIAAQTASLAWLGGGQGIGVRGVLGSIPGGLVTPFNLMVSVSNHKRDILPPPQKKGSCP